jgi:hypothetical protein
MSGALAYAEGVFTSNWLAVSSIAMILVSGVVFVRLALRELNSIAAASALGGAYQPARRSLFAGWRIFPPAASEEVNRQLLFQRNRVLAYTAIGIGVGAVLAAFVTAGLMLGLYPEVGQDISSPLSTDLLSIAMIAGAALGYTSGLLIVRRTNQFVAPSRGIRRSAWDYYSVWLWIIPAIITALSALTLFYASLGAHQVQIHWFGAPVSIPAPVAGGVVAAVLVLAVWLPLLMSALVASTPNILKSPDAQATQRANDDLRASVSAGLIGLAWLTTLTQDTDHLRSILGFPALNGLMNSLSTAATLLSVLIMISMLPVLLMLLIFIGRMGGRLTGWWWHRRPTPRERPAITE